MRNYILNPDHSVTPTDDLNAWAKTFEKEDRRVALDTFGDVRVSTVFLGIDHSFSQDGPPLLFETMVFDENGDEVYCHRVSTWVEAKAHHRKVTETVASLVRGRKRGITFRIELD